MAKAGQRTPAKISGERSKPRAKRRKRAAQAILRTTSQHFALTVRVQGLGLPAKTGRCLGALNPSLCIDRPRAGTWTPRQNGILPVRSKQFFRVTA